jgi:glycosyltransferase involved in cell wall biosynthesis
MPEALRILMLNIEYPPLGGGASPVTRGLGRALVALGHAVDVVTMRRRGLARTEDDQGVRVIRVPTLRARTELSHVHELVTYVASAYAEARALAAAHRYDVCHAHFVLPTGLVPYALRRRPGFPPYVLTCHGSDLPGYNPDRFRLLHRLTPWLIRRVLRSAAGVIVPSAALEGLLRARFAAACGTPVRIANGVDVERFAALEKQPRILVAARLFERKGVHQVIEALATLPGIGYGLEIAGDGPARADLERLARQTGVPCHFHGWLDRERLDRLFERCRIFVLPTSIDNFPVALLEAMAARCAIVTSRAGGCPEVVGDAALLVSAGDVRGLAEAVGTLVGDPEAAAALGARARARAERLFGWRVIAQQHETVYRGAVGAVTRALPRAAAS